jgi:hypothetical protein
MKVRRSHRNRLVLGVVIKIAAQLSAMPGIGDRMVVLSKLFAALESEPVSKRDPEIAGRK